MGRKPGDGDRDARDSFSVATSRRRLEYPLAVPFTPWNAQWHLRAELARILQELNRHLSRQRGRGRTAAADAVRGLVIEDGEAEGLVADLGSELRETERPTEEARPSPARGGPNVRDEIAERATLGEGQGAFLPLRHAARAFDLGPDEYDTLLLALAVEIDPRFGRLVAYLNDHVGRPRPTLGLALAIRSGGEGRALSPIELCARPIVRDGLLQLEGDGPLPAMAVRIPRDILPRLAGETTDRAEGGIARVFPPELGLLKRLVLSDDLRDQLAACGKAARDGRALPPLVLHGAEGSGRGAAARAIASEAGCALVEIDLATEGLADRLLAARREARWHRAALLLRASHPATPFDWGAVWAAIEDAERLLFLAIPTDLVDEVSSAAHRGPAFLEIPAPAPGERATLWKALLPPGITVPDSELADLAERFRYNPGRAARAVRRAVAEQALVPEGKRQGLGVPALEKACRDLGSSSMGPLAQKLPLPYRPEDLVVPPHVETELRLAVAWVRHQHQVLEEWGFSRRVPLGHGLTALFTGPPGTGKTMAAQILAWELRLDLHRVDLSQVMSKYIGDTEKNLARLFDAHGFLFFDEADALFGKRSEVKDAHDRYANLEIGYLLQRMESYDGVTVLATNRMRDMDEAFIRRFHVIVEFPMPSEADRLRIWQGMFPDRAARAGDLDLSSLARAFEMSGGEIKNSVLAAAYMAAAEKEPIGMSQLKRAIRRELVKSGKVVDEGAFAALG